MKLARHRSMAFWFGLLVIAFLSWAWWDSLKNASAAWGESFAVRSQWGGLDISHGAPPTLGGGGALREPIEADSPVLLEGFPAALFVSGDQEQETAVSVTGDLLFGRRKFITVRESLLCNVYWGGSKGWTLFIPYWLLMLACAVSWIGLLVLRARRRRKKLESKI